MIRFAPYIIAALIAGGGVWWVTGLQADLVDAKAEVNRLTRTNQALTFRADQAANARAVDAARAAFEREQDLAAADVQDQIRNADLGVEADASVDPALRPVLDGLRP